MKSFKLKRDSDDSILSELRKKGFSQHDFLDVIPARKPGADSKAALVTKEVQFLGESFLFIDSQGAFVNAAFFSELRSISVVDLSQKKHAILGTVLKEIPLDILVRFLILSDVICTYIHIESEMKVVFPSPNRAEVRGSHTYFTNEENIEPFAFSVEQDHTKTLHCLSL